MIVRRILVIALALSTDAHSGRNLRSPSALAFMLPLRTQRQSRHPNSLTNPWTDSPQDPYSKYTHLIAIPLESCSELTSALRNIQTSLVSDCPRLIRACIMPPLLRLPLLYVDATSDGQTWRSMDADVNALLEEVVQDAIQMVIYGRGAEKAATDAIETDATKDSNSSFEVPMVDPIMLAFRGLELQGEDNSVLYAVGCNTFGEDKSFLVNDEEEEDGVYFVEDWSSKPKKAATTTATTATTGARTGYQVLEELVLQIQQKLKHNHGMDTCWPCDNPQGQMEEMNDIESSTTVAASDCRTALDEMAIPKSRSEKKKWRPRVPFVRLPSNFYQDLENDLKSGKYDNEIENDSESSPIQTYIERGGDGISPLFWYEAWGEKDILPMPGVRMRSVAVYPRSMPGGGESESSFYMPTSYLKKPSKRQENKSSGAATTAGDENHFDTNHDVANNSKNSMDLPMGDAKLIARERREKAKEMDRMGEVESRAEREWEEGKALWLEAGRNLSPDEDLTTDSYFNEEYYSELDISLESGDISKEEDAATQFVSSPLHLNSDSAPVGESIASSRETNPSTGISRPSIEDNPVFQRLWKGQSQINFQGETSAQSLDGSFPITETHLPPFPSNEHFVGVWRVVSSPLATDNSIKNESLASQSSENLILRVDGQIMGGPILDSTHQHKAAGGSWKMFQAVRKSTEASEGSTPPTMQTRLRVRMLVPPEKVRALVMEGEVSRFVVPTGMTSSFLSSLDGWPTEKSRSDSDDSEETILYCGGEAWTEDVEGGYNRKKLGSFSLMKLKDIDRSKLIYTVPVSRGTMIASDDEIDNL